MGTLLKATAKQKCKIPDLYKEDYDILIQIEERLSKITEYTSLIKSLNAALDEAVRAKYTELSIDEIKELLINRKWYYTIFDGIKALYVTTSHNMASRISELTERYEDTLPELQTQVNDYEANVKAHLERMGFVW